MPRNPPQRSLDATNAPRSPTAAIVVLIVAVVLVYFNSLQGVFVFDDGVHIVQDVRLRRLSTLGEVLSGRRPIVQLTFALNYAVGALEVRGYHVVNVAIHLCAALALFGVVRRTLLTDRLRRRFGSIAHHMALATAILWAVHPLQTQSVTYLIQRSESMMGLLYLLTLYCLVRGHASAHGTRWYGVAVACCATGMGCKAVMVTAPVAVLFYDWVFLAATLRELLRRRWAMYVGLATTWTVLWASGVAQGVLDPSRTSATVGFGFQGISPVAYALTQPGVLVRYLMLAVWPAPLCLDYVWPAATASGAITPHAVVIAALAAVSVWAIVARRWWGFAGVWFFLVLSPTSSFVPIKDPMFEHRMYLPLAGIIAAATVGGYAVTHHLLSRLGVTIHVRRFIVTSAVAVAVVLLSLATIERNEAYASVPTMWRNVIATRPGNARAYEQLGTALVVERDLLGAIVEYEHALTIDPDFASVHGNLGNAYSQTGQFGPAVGHYRATLRLEPDQTDAWVNLGAALEQLDRHVEAMAAYREAIGVAPDRVSPETLSRAHYNLGSALARRSDPASAEVEFREALRLRPDYEKARYGLGVVCSQQGRLDDAIKQFRAVLAAKPNHARAESALRQAEARQR